MRGIILGIVVALSVGLTVWLNLASPTPAPPRTVKAPAIELEPEPETETDPQPTSAKVPLPNRPARNFSSLRNPTFTRPARVEVEEEPVAVNEEPIAQEEEIPVQPVEPQHEKWVFTEDSHLEDMLEVLEYIEDSGLEEVIFEDKIRQINELIEMREAGMLAQAPDPQEGGEVKEEQAAVPVPDPGQLQERERSLLRELISHPVLRKYITYEGKR